MKISADHLQAIVEHAVADAPNECCGIVATRDGVVTEVAAYENLAASPFRFDIDGMALFRHLERIESDGSELGAIYHSHTRSEPYPSQTDVNFAANWPGVEWIIVGVSKNAEPVVRSYLITADGTITEEDVESPEGDSIGGSLREPPEAGDSPTS